MNTTPNLMRVSGRPRQTQLAWRGSVSRREATWSFVIHPKHARSKLVLPLRRCCLPPPQLLIGNPVLRNNPGIQRVSALDQTSTKR